MADVAGLRREYARETLSEHEVLADPIAQFQRWFEQAVAAQVPEPNAMSLATSGASHQPTVRVVLLKGVDARGFVFFTDYRSRKGQDLAANANAGLCFYWGELERQVRVNGATERIPREESEEYFHTRPRGSQLGAWTSHQSSVLVSRDALDSALAATIARFGEHDVPLPEHWGGYRVVPSELEFWQGRANRLHDRVRYRRDGDAWRLERLSP